MNHNNQCSENSSFLGVQSLQPIDHFMKLVFGSTRPADEVARVFGAEKGSVLEKLLIQLCESFRRDLD